MWFLLAVVLVAPLVWALAGASPVSALVDLSPTVGLLLEPVPVEIGWLTAGVLLGALLGSGRARRTTTHLSTVAHEFGHGLAAALLGGRVNRIQMHRDGSGVAHTTLPGDRPISRFVVSASGYPAPGILALASIQVAATGLAGAWLAYLVAVLAVMVVTVRSWWGLLLTVGLAGAGIGVLMWAPGPAAGGAVAILAGALAGGGVVDAIGQWRSRRSARDLDAHSMSTQTGLPVGLFAGLHVLAAGALGIATLAVPLLAWG